MSTEQILEISKRAVVMSHVSLDGTPRLEDGSWFVGFKANDQMPLQASLPDRELKDEADIDSASRQLAERIGGVIAMSM
jgi:hypothetical protein